jgi:hypothetical protein
MQPEPKLSTCILDGLLLGTAAAGAILLWVLKDYL